MNFSQFSPHYLIKRTAGMLNGMWTTSLLRVLREKEPMSLPFNFILLLFIIIISIIYFSSCLNFFNENFGRLGTLEGAWKDSVMP